MLVLEGQVAGIDNDTVAACHLREVAVGIVAHVLRAEEVADLFIVRPRDDRVQHTPHPLIVGWTGPTLDLNSIRLVERWDSGEECRVPVRRGEHVIGGSDKDLASGHQSCGIPRIDSAWSIGVYDKLDAA
jgi:hypothetical protein